MHMKRKKCVTAICFIPVSLSCSLLLYVYCTFNSPYNVHRSYSLTDLPSPKLGHLKNVSKPWLGVATGVTFLEFNGLRTDVDRKEERAKKKKRQKLRRELAERCSWKIEEACVELQELIKEDEGRFLNGNESVIVSYNDSFANRRSWSSYADRGYTVIGQPNSLMKRLPQVLIIGVKKGGTRALLEFLRLHPSIRAAGPELHFFDRYFYRGTTWYRSKLPLSMEGQLTVEKTPAYFTDRDVPARVKEVLPTARILLVVRDPVVRAISDYTQSLSKHELRQSFRQLALRNSTTGMVNVGWAPIRGGLYARHLQRWRKYFSAANIHVVSGERLITDPAKEMEAVQDFLDLERIINDRHFYFNATKGFPCLMKREKNGNPHCLGFSKGRSHPQVDKDTLSILRDFYRPFNLKFYKMVGADFGWP